jgi:hypothetical protein
LILFLWAVIANAQTHTMPGSNVVPSGASLTINSGGSITAAAGSTVTGFGAGGGAPTTSTYVTQTPDGTLSAELALSTLSTGLLKSTTTTGALTTITDNSTNWNTAFTQTRQWDGGSTGLVAATGLTSLGGSTVGQSFFTLANPSAITFPEISATNVVSAKTAAQLKTDLSLTIGTNVEAWDTDLDTWAAITRATGFDAFVATPSSANLRTLMTDENGTGALLFSGATSPDFTTGITVGAAAASGKVLMGNGTVYTTSTATFPTGAPGAGKLLAGNGSNYVLTTPTYPNAAGAVGYTIRSDATNFASYPAQLVNSSTTSQATFSTSDIYVAGSNITVTAGDFKAGGQYKCVFDMTKSAGTGAIVITLRVGTLGTTGDAAIQTFTFGAGTAVADTGIFEVIATWRTVGSGTSAVMQGICRGTHNLATTGLFNNAGGFIVIGSPSPSSGFASNTATTIGLSFNGSTAFAGTATMVQSQLQQ